MSSTPRDSDGLRCLIALKISESEKAAEDEDSEDDEGAARQQDMDCYILTTQASIKRLPRTSRWAE
jgi:hypothetical protein